MEYFTNNFQPIIAPTDDIYESVDKSKILFQKYQHERQPNKELTVSKEKFEALLDESTSNLFLCMNWSNMVIAGGSTLALLTQTDDNVENEFADIDIFLYGLDERGLNRKVVEIYNTFKEQLETEIQCYRTVRTISFMYGKNKRVIQIIIKKHDTINDILNAFDIDCSCVAYDGQNIHYNRRFVDAIKYSTNKLDLSLRSASYEYRLAKYGRRGYATFVDDLDISRVNNQIYSKNVKYQKDLAKLLVLSKLNTDAKFQLYCDTMDYYQASMRRNIELKNDYGEHSEHIVSEYESTFIPKWNGDLEPKNYVEKLTELNKSLDCKMFYMGTINDLINGPTSSKKVSKYMKPIKKQIKETTTNSEVEGKLVWHDQINDEDNIFIRKEVNEEIITEWYNSAYNENNLLEDVLIAIRENNIQNLTSLIQDVDINSRDISSRVPIHEAIIYNNMTAMIVLIDNDCDLTFVSKLKKTPLHTACEVGNIEAVKLILQHYPAALNEYDSYMLTPMLYSMMYDHLDIFKLLWKKSGQPDRIIWEYKHDNTRNYNGLEICLMFDATDIAKYLLNKKYDINDHCSNSKYHILYNCIKLNNIEFFTLLTTHSRSYSMKYSKSILTDHVEAFIKRMHSGFDPQFSINSAHTMVKFLPKTKLIFTFMTSLIDNCEENMVLKFIKDENIDADINNGTISLLDSVDKTIQKLEVVDVKSHDTNDMTKYSYQTVTMENDELYIIPEWIIRNECENTFVKSTKSHKPIQTDNTVKFNFYLNIRAALLANKATIKKIKLSKYAIEDDEDESDEESDDCIIIEPKKKTKKVKQPTFVDSDEDCDSDEDMNTHRCPPSLNPVLNTSKYATKVTKKTYKKDRLKPEPESESEDEPIYKRPVKKENYSLHSGTKTITIGVESQSNTIETFKLFDDIYNNKIITTSTLENMDLLSYLTKTKTKPLYVAANYNSEEMYEQILRLILTQTIETDEAKDDPKYNFIPELLSIFEFSNIRYETLYRVILDIDNTEINDYIIKYMTKILNTYVTKMKDEHPDTDPYHLLSSYVTFIEKLTDNDYKFGTVNKSTSISYSDILIKAHTCLANEVIDYLISLNIYNKKYLLNDVCDTLHQHWTDNSPMLLLKLLPYDIERTIHPLCNAAQTENKVFDCLLEYMDINDTDEDYQPLHVAIRNKCFTNVQKILTKYPHLLNVQTQHKKHTPLMLAISLYDIPITEYILSLNPDQNIVNIFGNTALHCAVMTTNAKATPLLIAHNQENYFKMTPNDYVVNMMRSYFHHVRNKKINIKYYRLAFVIRLYKTFVLQNNNPRLYASKQHVNDTNDYILDSMDSITTKGSLLDNIL